MQSFVSMFSEGCTVTQTLADSNIKLKPDYQALKRQSNNSQQSSVTLGKKIFLLDKELPFKNGTVAINS